jgi:hypothetical protein
MPGPSRYGTRGKYWRRRMRFVHSRFGKKRFRFQYAKMGCHWSYPILFVKWW